MVWPRNRAAFWLLLWLALAVAPARAQSEVWGNWLSQVLTRAPQLSFSFLVVRERDGVELVAYDADRALIPASCLKLVSAALILDRVGPLSRLTTRLGVAGRLEPGADLYLVGDYDPELRRADLDELAAQLAGQVREWHGRLLVVRPPGRVLGSGWAWDDAPDDYSAEVTGLSIDHGLVHGRLLGGPPIRLQWPAEAPTPELALESGPETNWRWLRLPGRAGTRLEGSLARGADEALSLTVVEPDLYAGRVLATALGRHGLAPTEVAVVDRAPELTTLVEHQSRPVAEILKLALEVSDNQAMEMLYRKAGVPPGPVSRMVDGSGLSRYNLVCARQLVEVLRSHPQLASLVPVAGQTGTLSRRMREGLAYGQVHAKTGTMSGVSSLAGYLFADDPERRCRFALISNGYVGPMSTVKGWEDQLIEALVKRIGYPYLP